MPESLEDLLLRLSEDRTLFLSGEEATRQGAILPILARLGWDRDNIREVVPEFRVGNGRVDYCLKIGERTTVFIEVKRTNQELEQHQEQLLDYAFREGVEIAVLTNGLLWWLYLPLLTGSWDQRKFFTIDIQQQGTETAAQHFRGFLGRDVVASGNAMERARAVHASREKNRLIQQTIPKAWNQLCQEPDELLLEIFADKVESLCGHKPGQELLAEYLTSVNRSIDIQPLVSQVSQKSSLPQLRSNASQTHQGRYTFTRPIAFTFKGERRQVSSFRDILLGFCQVLYQTHTNEFERVLELQGRKRSHFSRDFENMKDPQEILNSGIYAETNLSANSIIDRCYDLLALFNYPRSSFEVEVQPRETY